MQSVAGPEDAASHSSACSSSVVPVDGSDLQATSSPTQAAETQTSNMQPQQQQADGQPSHEQGGVWPAYDVEAALHASVPLWPLYSVRDVAFAASLGASVPAVGELQGQNSSI